MTSQITYLTVTKDEVASKYSTETIGDLVAFQKVLISLREALKSRREIAQVIKSGLKLPFGHATKTLKLLHAKLESVTYLTAHEIHLQFEQMGISSLMTELKDSQATSINGADIRYFDGYRPSYQEVRKPTYRN